MIVKIKVKDRTDSNKQVELERYVINQKDTPIGIVFGKFSPWTGEHGHGNLVEHLKKIGIKKFYVVSPKRNTEDTEKYGANIFSPDSRRMIIDYILKDVDGYSGVIQSESNNLLGVIKHITQTYDRPVFIVGPDRTSLAEKNFVPYGSKPSPTQEYPDFGKPEILVYRGDKNVSGTKVRTSLVDDDYESFHKLTNYDLKTFNYMKSLMTKKQTFKEHYELLFEGGNLRIGDEAATKINLTEFSLRDVENLKKRIKDALISLSEKLSKKNEFWNDYIVLIQKNEVFSGSSKHFFQKSIVDFKKVKTIVGDIDIQFPIEFEEELETYIKDNAGKTFGKLKLIGLGGKSPIQTNTLFKDSVTGLNIQIDFEPIDFKDRFPSEFARFSRSSDWKDLNENIKGVFHKYLLRCLVGREQLPDLFLVTTYDKKKSKWKVSKKQTGPNLLGFSVDRGVRVKFERAKNAEGLEFFVDQDGTEYLEQEQNTKPAYVETDTKTYDYIKDISKIATICFGSELTDSELETFSSFLGCCELIKKYIPNDAEEVAKGFFNLLFGKLGQEIEQGDFVNGINENDFNVKLNACSHMSKILFNKHVDSIKDFNEDEQKEIQSYYFKLKAKK